MRFNLNNIRRCGTQVRLQIPCVLITNSSVIGKEHQRNQRLSDIDLHFGNVFVRSLGVCRSSWRVEIAFAETQGADRCEPKTRAKESSGMCTIIITVAVQHSGETQRDFYTAWLLVAVPVWTFFALLEWDEAAYDSRYSAKAATHTCAKAMARQHTCSHCFFIHCIAIWNQKWKNCFTQRAQ